MKLLTGVDQVAADGALQLGACEPVVAQGLDVRRSGVDLVALGEEKLEDAGEHRVVLELGLPDDSRAQLQESGPVPLGEAAGLIHPRACSARALSLARSRSVTLPASCWRRATSAERAVASATLRRSSRSCSAPCRR